MRVLKYTVFVTAALALAGCEGTDRPLSFGEKGVYSGKKDTELTSEQVETLRQRGRQQNQP